MLTMYPGMVNSPITELAAAIDDVQTTITVVDGTKLPDAPNLAIIGRGEDAETILYTEKTGNVLSGVVRGFQGVAKAWGQGARIARFFTEYDQRAMMQNIQENADNLAAHLNDFAKLQFGNRPYVSTEDKTYYIDAVNGNDENDGESPATAFKTWAKVESMIPRILHHGLTIRIIGHLPEVISVKGLIIAGESSVTNTFRIVGDTEIASNHEINGAKFVAVTGAGGDGYIGCMLERVRSNGIIQINGCTGVTIHRCEPRNFGGPGIRIGNSIARVTDCNFGTDVVQIAISAAAVSRVFSRNNIGQATLYGLYAGEGSTIFKFGTQPTGSTANEHIYQAGEIK